MKPGENLYLQEGMQSIGNGKYLGNYIRWFFLLISLNWYDSVKEKIWYYLVEFIKHVDVIRMTVTAESTGGL